MRYVFILSVLVSCGRPTHTKYREVTAPAKDSALICQVYDITGEDLSKLQDLSVLQSIGEISVKSLSNPNTGADQTFNAFKGTEFEELTENFALSCEGVLKLDTKGLHTFILASDDGSRLYINGIGIVDNDGNHGITYRQADVNLTSTNVNVKVEFYNGFGPKALTLSMREPGVSFEELVKF